MVVNLPPWLREWAGAEAIAAGIDPAALRADVRELVDAVLSEDGAALDALPEAVESALVAPLAVLAELEEQDAGLVELVVAARVVRRSVRPVAGQCPPELLERIMKLPECAAP